MSIFDKQDREAAAKAIRDNHVVYETAEQYSAAKADAALDAAEASLRERGKLFITEDYIPAYEMQPPFRGTVAIIRMEENP